MEAKVTYFECIRIEFILNKREKMRGTPLLTASERGRFELDHLGRQFLTFLLVCLYSSNLLIRTFLRKVDSDKCISSL